MSGHLRPDRHLQRVFFRGRYSGYLTHRELWLRQQLEDAQRQVKLLTHDGAAIRSLNGIRGGNFGSGYLFSSRGDILSHA